MRWIVAGAPTPPEALSFVEHGFAPAAGDVPWSLQLSMEAFIAVLAAPYHHTLAELRRDDALVGRFEPPFPGATDYPPLARFVEVEGPWFAGFFDTFLRFDLLRALLTEASGSANVWLTSVRVTTHSGGHVRLEGLCRVVPR